ncbi:PSD1 and planctomycete cytochrome C domain-containing protein [Planctomicrobium sp. SH661]|uniref:PSD1 and planctomycete cytochrome C domain-containing protein n=1 Tax=Planctomicrobium sp. SH661 TaxID=3448124 RepID=UPI003F5BDC03
MFHPVRTLGIACVVLGGLSFRAHAEDNPDASAAFFENEIRPLLVEHCIQCHGPKKSESGLRLDQFERVMKGGDSGPAIVPGHPDESLILKAIRHEDGLEMPPEGKLNDHQISAVTRWINAGSHWPDGMKLAGEGPALRSGPVTDEDRAFWSFQPAVDSTPPQVETTAASHNAIDQFILKALQEKGLTTRPPADKRTLLRRATYDLTGLPPSPEEMDAFLADDSPRAFETVVERLLASPAYGERWGRHWLDVVRYADTAGETADYPAPLAFQYRNWVINAVNADQPYDEFLREQIAGDILGQKLLEEAHGSLDARTLQRYRDMMTATGFIAISRRFGFDSQNYQYLTIQDTIDTIGQSVLGLTLGCARCHDHKFDPVNTDDYYAWYGIFDSTLYSFPGSEEKKRPADLFPSLPDSLVTTTIEEYDANMARLDQEILQLREQISASSNAWIAAGFDGFEEQPLNESPNGQYQPLGQVTVTESAQSPFDNVFVPGTRGFAFPSNGENNAFLRKLEPAHTAQTAPVLYYNLDFRNHTAPAGGSRGYRLYLGRGPGASAAVELGVGATELFVRNGEHYQPIHQLLADEWYNLQLVVNLETRTYSGTVRSSTGVAEFSNIAFSPGWDGTIDTTFVDAYGPLQGIPPAHDIDNLAVSMVPFVREQVSEEEQKQINKQIQDWKVQMLALEKERARQKKAGPFDRIYGARETASPHDSPIQLRGEPLKPGPVVPRKDLTVLSNEKVAEGAGSGRLQLAEWLTRPENPLTARVMANRIWQRHFGNGLVGTENDFGFRGERPSHPELLDWLTVRFKESGWSLKAMHRLIMASAAYQQGSDADPAAAELDPDNRLLWRFSPRRLSAEEIRDSMMFVSGELDPAMDGPHPFPEPETWNYSQHGPFYAAYPSSHRSIYLMQQRMKQHPFLGLFDGADTNASTPHRQLTTVPTQALYLMNNEFIHNSSRLMAQRFMQSSDSDEVRINNAFLSAFGRPAEANEIQESLEFLARYQSAMATAPADQALASSWAALMRTLLIRNEFLFVN